MGLIGVLVVTTAPSGTTLAPLIPGGYCYYGDCDSRGAVQRRASSGVQ